MKNSFKLFGIISLAAVIGFGLAACSGTLVMESVDKSIIITGIKEGYSTAEVLIVDDEITLVASGTSDISSGSVTVSLLDDNDVPYTGTGSFYVMLILSSEDDGGGGEPGGEEGEGEGEGEEEDENGVAEEGPAYYIYTGNTNDVELDDEETALKNVKKARIATAETPLYFNLFQKAPDWMKDFYK